MNARRLSQTARSGGEASWRARSAPRGAVVALAVTIAILGIAVALGGAPLIFINVPSLLLVFGGTLAAVTLATSWTEVRAASRAAVASLADDRSGPASDRDVAAASGRDRAAARHAGAAAGDRPDGNAPRTCGRRCCWRSTG